MKNSTSSDSNSKLIFDFLFANRDRSISEISKSTNLSSPTVAKCINDLINKGLVKAKGKVSTQKGRFPTIYDIDVRKVLFLGIETKKTSATVGIISTNGDVVLKKDYNLESENSNQTLTMLIEKINEFLAEDPEYRDRIAFATFNISGRVNSELGQSYSRYNFEDDSMNLANVLSEGIRIPSSIENDTRAMAIAENILGAGREFKTYLYLNISSGVGLSIIADGKIFRGRDGYSGEIGHFNVYNNNIICQCGKKGCLETEVSGRALCRKMNERIANGEKTILLPKISSGAQINENDIIDAALHDDQLAIDILGKAGDELGKMIANLINLFNPEAVIIGGTLSRAGKYFLEPTLYGVTKYSLARLCRNVTIKYSTLQDSGIKGAGMIACSKYFKQSNKS